MRHISLLSGVCSALLLSWSPLGSAASAESATAGPVRGGTAEFTAEFPSGGSLAVHVRSGDVQIVGGGEDKILVRYSGQEALAGHTGKVTLTRTGRRGALEITGFPRNHFQVIVQVPQRLALRVRMPAGDLGISGVIGDKDIELHAGDLTVEVGERGQYAHVDASVLAGDLSAQPFGVQKDGLFRSFEMKGAGAYRLHAHVGAGDLTFRN